MDYQSKIDGLILKESAATIVDVTECGLISIEQRDDVTGEFANIYLTLDQLKAIEKYVANNYLEIAHLWNGGAER